MCDLKGSGLDIIISIVFTILLLFIIIIGISVLL